MAEVKGRVVAACCLDATVPMCERVKDVSTESSKRKAVLGENPRAIRCRVKSNTKDWPSPNCPRPLLRWAKMCYNSRHKEFLLFVSICANVNNKV
jgi:hypothetical protein